MIEVLGKVSLWFQFSLHIQPSPGSRNNLNGCESTRVTFGTAAAAAAFAFVFCFFFFLSHLRARSRNECCNIK